MCYELVLSLSYVGSNYSNISTYSETWLDLTSDLLYMPLYLSIPVGDSLLVYRVFRSCVMKVSDVYAYADLIILDMSDFDVIIGIDLLSH